MAIKLTHRPTTAADQEGISQLAHRSFGASTDQSFIAPDLLRWKYWLPRADFTGPRSYVMQREQRIVAHVGLWPVSVGNERGVHMIDWMADADAPGAGVMLLSRLTKLFDFVYTIGGSSTTRQILPKFGFKLVGDAFTWARPIRPFRQILDHQYSDWRIPARLARNLWWSRFPNYARTNDWKIISTDAGCFQERNEEFFCYLRACPVTTCQTFQIQRGDRQEGCFALITVKKQARIAGIWLREPCAEHMQVALALAQEAALGYTDACEVVARGLPESTRIAAHNAGMRLRNKEPILVFKNPGTTEGLSLGFQMADNDAIFLRERVPRFLT